MIKKIDSVQNNVIKFIVTLHQKKHIQNNGICFVEGEKIVIDLIKANKPIKMILITQDKINKLSSVINKLNNKLQIVCISEKVAKKISNTVTNAGVFALAEITKPAKFNSNENFIVLDNVQNPTNVGAIVRTALAYNIKQIFFLNSVYAYLPQVIRSSMGHILNVDIFNFTLTEFKNLVKVKKLNLVCAHLNGESLLKFKNNFINYGIVVGNEGNGVNSDVLKLCNKTITIPMQNNVESFNVAVSFAIIVHHFSLK